MKAIRVQYTVQKDYVEQNQERIRKVMADLRDLNNPNIQYAAFLLEDGQSFMHLAVYPDEETSQIVPNLESFKDFRMGLKASKPINPPHAQDIELVGAAFEYFK